MIKFNNTTKKQFELVVNMRDAKGNPTGRTHTLATNNTFQLWKFWERHRPATKKKKASKEQSYIPTSQETVKIMKDVDQYVSKKYSKPPAEI